jgi:hypothetical protein
MDFYGFFPDFLHIFNGSLATFTALYRFLMAFTALQL